MRRAVRIRKPAETFAPVNGMGERAGVTMGGGVVIGG
jgi:hypothetical protein